MSLTFEPPFPPALIVLFDCAVFGAALAIGARQGRKIFRRTLPLLLLRGVLLSALLVVLCNPVVRRAAPPIATRPVFTLLLDTSRSMNAPDASGGTRWQAAQQLTLQNQDLLRALQRKYEIRFAGFDSRLVPQSPESLRNITRPDGGSTNLGDALRQAAGQAGQTPQGSGLSPVLGGILLVSDGRDTSAGFPLEAARNARRRGLPVYTLCIGQTETERDLQVTTPAPQVFAAPGQTLELKAELRTTGLPATQTQVDLLREGRRVQSKIVTIAPGTRDLVFEVNEPRKGLFRYAVVAAPVSGESDTTNNRAGITLHVLDSRTRVLLLEGQPTWDAKFLAQALRDDPTIALDSVFVLTDTHPYALSGGNDRPDVKAPHTLADFAQYDVVIVGKGYEALFGAESTENLKRWISERGGNLIFLRGRPDEHTDALRELEPVTFGTEQIENARAALTEAGRNYPGFAFSNGADAQTVISKLPSLITATQSQGEKALTVVLARTAGANAESKESEEADATQFALLAYQRFGQGKVMAVIGEGLWRWAFLPPDKAQYGTVYADFWTQTVRWLVSESDFLPGQNLSLRTDRTAYAPNETVNLLGYIRGAKTAPPLTITITTPDGKTVAIQSVPADGKTADFAAAFHPALPGEYLAAVGPLPGSEKNVPASAVFTVTQGQTEDANRAPNPKLMRQIASSSGGEMLNPASLPALPEKLHALEMVASQQKETRTVWDTGSILFFLLGLLTLEWVIRRRFGLFD